jgi:hypothetical protein
MSKKYLHQDRKDRKDRKDREKERLSCFLQTVENYDPLYVNFRADESVAIYQKFKSQGLSIERLLKLQSKIPVIYPWNTEYSTLRFNVNRCFNCYPQMIVMAKCEKDIISALKFARKYSIDFVMRGGAHSFEGLSLCQGMIIDQSRRNHIHINCCKETTTVEPGVLLGPLIDELSKHKLALPTGLCSNNCVTGYVLGGGIGLLTRMYGVTADSLLELRVLLADGTIVTGNQKCHEDLFWACQGAGGGNFGIILSLKFKVYPIDHVHIFHLDYSPDKLKDLIKLWQTVGVNYPKNLTVDLRALAGNTGVGISGQYLSSDKSKLLELIKPFTEIEHQTFDLKWMKYVDAVRYFASTRWHPFFKMKTSFIDQEFSEDTLDIFEKYMKTGLSSFNISMKAMGGQNDEYSEDHIAFPHRKMKGWFLIDAQWDTQEQETSCLNWLNRFHQELLPSLPDRVYVNSPDLTLNNPFYQYYRNNLPRLIEIKKKYDPNNCFKFKQGLCELC